jgi:hypothetical protein
MLWINLAPWHAAQPQIGNQNEYQERNHCRKYCTIKLVKQPANSTDSACLDQLARLGPTGADVVSIREVHVIIKA